MKIFALDSSANSASVALTDGSKILGEFFVDTGFTHSQTLMPMIQSLYKNVGVNPRDTDLFACCTGPGSFTGVRIGVASVKGMALSLSKPCIKISSLEAMAYSFLMLENYIICACMDARRQQVYNALFSIDNGKVKRLCDDRAIACEELSEDICKNYSKKNVILVGNGADLCYNIFGEDFVNVSLAPSNLKYCRASAAALGAFSKLSDENFVNANSLNPTYLRMPQAQRNLLNKKNSTTA